MSEPTSKGQELCREIEERMSELLDGTAPDALYDHVAECDRCRDARHDAERAAELVASAGKDFALPAGFEERLGQALDGAAPPNAETEPAGKTELSAGTAPKTEAVPAAAFAVVEPAAAPKTEPMAAVEAKAVEAKPVVEAVSTGAELKPIEDKFATAASPGPAATAPQAGGGAKVVSLLGRLRRPRNALAVSLACALAAAAVVAVVVRPGGSKGTGALAGGGSWQGKVVKVSRAAGGDGGLEQCDGAGQSCKPLGGGERFAAGSVLRTDDRTRAYVELDDGTRLALDRSTRWDVGGAAERRAKLEAGAVVADVAHIDGSSARIDLPSGYLEVLGTKFALRALGESVAVDVSRGLVKLTDAQGRSTSVRAGEEGRVYPGMAPYSSGASALGEALTWSENDPNEPSSDNAVRGLGELRAKKPGSEEERKGAVRLTSHQVKVRIVDGFARTEVEEVFTNTTGEVLEGIYRFPMPPDAQIERLALEVDGKYEEGAFVDREKAAAIWRGAIQNAAPKSKPLQEEIVWVPGPWRDPALLEWQRGGRFELKIYPIPKQGSRKVVLGYTQVVKPTGRVMRYVYPLAHDASGALRVDDFGVDAQVRGHDKSFGVSTQGYAFASSPAGADDAEKLGLNAKGFVPSGDLVLEYALPAGQSELESWAYAPAPGSSPAATSTPVAAPVSTLANPPNAGGKGLPKAAKPPKPAEESSLLAGVSSDAPYVLFALRPKLPRSAEQLERSFVLVVDSSRSMVGERYKRASELAVRLVEELDPLDRFTVMACDTSCRQLGGGARFPGKASAEEVKRFLAGITPEGASDLGTSMRAARTAAGDTEGRALRVIYLGDGTPTVGPIRPRYLERAVRDALVSPSGQATVTAVAIGTDADLDALGAMARAGGGTVLPYVPGQRLGEAAYAILGASYGTGLREVKVELPSGLVEVAPEKLDTIPPGGEALVVARMTSPTLDGTMVVRGKVGAQDYEQRYPIKLQATSAAGNAFVPRMYAALRIGDLERLGTADARTGAVGLSQRFNVASRYTSLLVLESQAMFKAFGLDNTRVAPEWTGEEQIESAKAKGEVAMDEEGAAEKKGDLDSIGATGGVSAGAGRGASRAKSAPRDFDDFGPAADAASEAQAPRGPAPVMAAPSATMAPPAKEAARPPATVAREPQRRRGNMIAMRKIWERIGTVMTAQQVPSAAGASKLGEAEQAVRDNENRRDAVKKLFGLRLLAGQLDGARELAERWSQKEALDPDALVARADAAASAGNRDEAIRILGSVVDVRPADVGTQVRLARLQRWAGRAAVGCRHSIALAQLRERDAKALAEAVFCARQTGEGATAEDMLSAADAETRGRAETELGKMKPPEDKLRGELRLDASWQGSGTDLDLALLGPDGRRISWLGVAGKGQVSAVDVTSSSHEGLALLGSEAGDYVIEVTRASGEGPASGTLTVDVAGTHQQLPFNLGPGERRKTLGLANVRWQSRLVPL